MLKRLDKIEVATSDLEDAVNVYRRNFGITINRPPDGERAVLAVGGAEIELVARAPAGERTSAADALAGLWLEVDDVEAAARLLSSKGIQCADLRQEAGRRVLAVASGAADGVALTLFDRK
jgi:predicted enzyme related to lactoylglutathione lyase